jgi:hypothetical protein
LNNIKRLEIFYWKSSKLYTGARRIVWQNEGLLWIVLISYPGQYIIQI